MSASVVAFRSLTVPACMPLTFSAASTLRRVTGNRATPSFSANRSTIPKGAAANFAKGGIGPVATLSGKLSAFFNVRPDASLKPLGSSTVNWVCSGMRALKLMLLMTLSPSDGGFSLFSKMGLKLSLPAFSRIPSTSLRGTGALKFRLIARMGKQAAWAFSRSQLKVAAKGSRTVKSKRFSIEFGMPSTPPAAGVATPLPQTNCTLADGVKRRLHARVTMFKGDFSAAEARPCDLSSAALSAPSISRTATRSPRPSTAHHTFACTLARVAGPLRRSVKNCSSSMRLPE